MFTSGVVDRVLSGEAFGRPPNPSLTFVKTRWLTDFCLRTLLPTNGARLGESGLMLWKVVTCCVVGARGSIAKVLDQRSLELSCTLVSSISFQPASSAIFDACFVS
jgi:hypothetical protein